MEENQPCMKHKISQFPFEIISTVMTVTMTMTDINNNDNDDEKV